jgi:hypothetical protein
VEWTDVFPTAMDFIDVFPRDVRSYETDGQMVSQDGCWLQLRLT